MTPTGFCSECGQSCRVILFDRGPVYGMREGSACCEAEILDEPPTVEADEPGDEMKE